MSRSVQSCSYLHSSPTLLYSVKPVSGAAWLQMFAVLLTGGWSVFGGSSESLAWCGLSWAPSDLQRTGAKSMHFADFWLGTFWRGGISFFCWAVLLLHSYSKWGKVSSRWKQPVQHHVRSECTRGWWCIVCRIIRTRWGLTWSSWAPRFEEHCGFHLGLRTAVGELNFTCLMVFRYRECFPDMLGCSKGPVTKFVQGLLEL